MPTISSDLRLVVSRKKYIKSSPDGYKLGYDPVFTPPKRRVKSSTPTGRMKDTSEEPTLTAEDIVQGCDRNLQTVDQLLDKLRNRCKNLTMKVNRSSQPVLFESCTRFFDNFDGEITFDMYEKVLRLNTQLCRQLRMPVNAATQL